jgi:hypothetical protein
VKHINPFARANGEDDPCLNDRVKGNAQCEEDMVVTGEGKKQVEVSRQKDM